MSINEVLVKRIMTHLYHEYSELIKKTLLKREGRNLQNNLLREKKMQGQSNACRIIPYIQGNKEKQRNRVSFFLAMYSQLITKSCGLYFPKTMKCLHVSSVISQSKLPYSLPYTSAVASQLHSNQAFPFCSVYLPGSLDTFSSLNKLWSS